jgi:predicted nucleic acid-binding protein
VDLIIDASSVINLDNAGALELVARLRERTLWLSPLVVGECEPTCAAEILRLVEQGLIRLVNAQNISAEVFLDLLQTHELGEGETECLALCLGHPYVFCCDDSKARHVGVQLLDEPRVIGSLRLLKWCVGEGLATAEIAFSLYKAMNDAGGFLPNIAPEWFEEPD